MEWLSDDTNDKGKRHANLGHDICSQGSDKKQDKEWDVKQEEWLEQLSFGTVN